ncbi:MAG: DUF72 domain-containing protein [Caldithrix sp.]|nr:DUF72 domain-containing protein [Caldithrix sp.]
MKIDFKIGTSGYSYDDWNTVFYPQQWPKSERLSYYSRYFDTVEINATYYRVPPRRVFEGMVSKTGPQFEFIVKAHQDTTHMRHKDTKALQELKESIKPLIQAERLNGILAQFPYSFHNNEKNRAYLRRIKEGLEYIPLFVEFRNDSWLKPQIYDLLSYHDIGYVNVDEPPLRGLLPPQHIVTTNTAYIRFHGRNENQWWRGKGSDRYDYEYREQELIEWLNHLSEIMKKTHKSYFFFNNHPRGQAVKNARQMMRILEKQFQFSFDQK